MGWRFLKEFCINANRNTKYLAVGLIQIALRRARRVPLNFVNQCAFLLKRNGNNPFGQLFCELAKDQESLHYLRRINIRQRVVELLLATPETKESIERVDLPLESFAEV